jgi:hypothetical protein
MRVASICQSPFVLGGLGAVLLVGSFAAPTICAEADAADLVTRQTARVGVLFWGIAAVALLVRQRTFGRWAWTFGCIAYLVHVATAFDRVHQWSHAAAVQHVETVSGVGAGLFVSYAFTILWFADLLWWWTDRVGYDARPNSLNWFIHGFMAFVVFNATVIYETGLIRWAGVGLFGALAMLLAARLWSRKKFAPAR